MRTADRMGPLSAECINRPDDRKHRRLAQFDLCEWPRGTSHMPSMACCLGAQSSSKELESEILMRYSMHYPPVWFSPCDFKSGCLWMLSLKLTAVQRAQVLKTASDLCVMARRDRDSVLSPIPPYDSRPISQQVDGWWTDGRVRPFSSPCCGNLAAILSGCIFAVWPIFIDTSLGQMRHRSEGRGRKIGCLPSLRPLHVFSRGRNSMVPLFPKHKQGHIYTCWRTRTHSSSWIKMQLFLNMNPLPSKPFFSAPKLKMARHKLNCYSSSTSAATTFVCFDG